MPKRGRRRSKKFVYKRLIDANLDTVLNRYVEKSGSSKKGKQKKKKKKKKKTIRRQIGGAIPWVVDFKKGGEIVSDLVKDGFTIDHNKAKKQYDSDRAEWKKSGQGQSWEDWARSNGKIEDSKCTIL